MRWFGHIERMGSEEFVKKVLSESVGPNSRGKPPGRWRDRVKKYLCERFATRRGESIWIWRGGGFTAVTTPMRNLPRERARH